MADPMTVPQVAAHFGVNQSAVRKWALAGKLAAVRTLGGQWRFDPDTVALFTPQHHAARARGCDFQGCDRPHHARRLCKKHYKQQRNPGGAFDLDDAGEL